MNGIQWDFLILAILAVMSLGGVGISIGFQSVLGIIVSLVFFIIFMGIGFTLKRKKQA